MPWWKIKDDFRVRIQDTEELFWIDKLEYAPALALKKLTFSRWPGIDRMQTMESGIVKELDYPM